MIVPNMPNDRKVVDDNGVLTEVWASFFSNLIIELGFNISDEGVLFPKHNSAIIASLGVDENKGRAIWNTDTEKAMVNNDGTFKEIVTL